MNIYDLETRSLNLSNYQALRSTTDWHPIHDLQVQEALKHDLFSVCIYSTNKAIGMGRVIGDGAIYFYIQDVIVHPEHKGMGVGKLIMTAIETFLNKTVKDYAFIGLMAAKDVEGFYNQFGYTKRANDSPGMHKAIKN